MLYSKVDKTVSGQCLSQSNQKQFAGLNTSDSSFMSNHSSANVALRNYLATFDSQQLAIL